jgi:hypothetical protein
MAYRRDWWFRFWERRAALLLWTFLFAPLMPAQPTGDLRLREAIDRGRMEPGRRLSRITLTLRRDGERQAALDELLREQQDPRSPKYQKWLSPEEFGLRFGASNPDLDRVAGWLRAKGLEVDRKEPWRIHLVCCQPPQRNRLEFALHDDDRQRGIG